MNHKHWLILVCFLIILTLQGTESRQFPLGMISAPNCKYLERKDHDESCKIDIHSIDISDTTHLSPVGQLVYSMLRGASYIYQWDSEKGGHPGIDIASAKGTPVYAIGPGKVTRSGRLFGYGNSITIKHRYQEKDIFSNYSHLSEILVKKGDFVQEGKQIGAIGKSGMSIGKYGHHLDFQITTDKSPHSPYGYSDCKAGYLNAVNNGSCREKMKEYTINPLVFFQTQNKNTPVPKTTKHLIEKIVTPNINYDEHTVAPIQQKQNTPLEIKFPIKKEKIGETETFNKKYKIITELKQFGHKLTVGKISKLTIHIIDNKTGEKISGRLDKEIHIDYDASYITILPSSFKNIYNGKKDLFIRTNKKGTSNISIYYGDNKTPIGVHQITIE